MAKSKEYLLVEAYQNGSLRRWVSAGATYEQIADNLGISESSFYKYLDKHSEIVKEIQHARTPVIIEAFAGLARLSQGFHEKKVSKHKKIVTHTDGTKDIIEEIYEDDEYYPPQHQACTKVIVNYLNQLKKGEGVPEEYITEPVVVAQEKLGTLPEMEEAFKALIIGDSNGN